jgi:hypothetical protein
VLGELDGFDKIMDGRMIFWEKRVVAVGWMVLGGGGDLASSMAHF